MTARPFLGLLLVMALLLGACAPVSVNGGQAPAGDGAAAPAGTPAGQPTAPSAGDALTVYAASSLTDAFTELGALFGRRTGTRVELNFGASSALWTQIEQGAAADVFASASMADMQALERAGLLRGDPAVFANNRLVIVVPRDNPAGINAPRDLAKPGVKFVAAQPGVPVGQYAATALERMSADTAYGADFKARGDANTVSREDNVRTVLAKVTLGEADASIVYASDVPPAVRDKVATVAIPDPFNPLATYPIAAVRNESTGHGPSSSWRWSCRQTAKRSWPGTASFPRAPEVR